MDAVTILRLEERLLRAEVRASPEALAELLAGTFVEFGSSGNVFDRAHTLELLPSEPAVPVSITDFTLTPLAADVALVTYRAHRQQPDGTVVSLRSSIWRWLDDCWQVIFHQGTRQAGPSSPVAWE